MKNRYVTKLSSKGTVVLPVEVMDMLNAEVGDRIEFTKVGDKVVVKVVKRKSSKDSMDIT